MKNANSNQPPIACDLTVLALVSASTTRLCRKNCSLLAARCGNCRTASRSYFLGRATGARRSPNGSCWSAGAVPSYLLSLSSKQIAARWSCACAGRKEQRSLSAANSARWAGCHDGNRLAGPGFGTQDELDTALPIELHCSV